MRHHLRTILDRVRNATSSGRVLGIGNRDSSGRGGSNDGRGRLRSSSGSRSDAPILTNEERVVQVLSEYDGKLWQNRVVEETEWSKSKVSRVLSEMEDDGAVRRRQVGRRKVVYLPEAEPEFFESDGFGADEEPGPGTEVETEHEPETEPYPSAPGP